MKTFNQINGNCKPPDVDKIVATLEDGKQVVVLTSDKMGSFDGKLFDFGEIEENEQIPQKPNFDETFSEVSLLTWDGRTDVSFNQDYNSNIRDVQKNINAFVSILKKIIKFIDDLNLQEQKKEDYLKKLIAALTAKYLSDNYYPKSEIDAKVNQLQQQFNDFTNQVLNGQVKNQFGVNVMPPKVSNSLSGDAQITNADVKSKLKRLNQQGGK